MAVGTVAGVEGCSTVRCGDELAQLVSGVVARAGPASEGVAARAGLAGASHEACAHELALAQVGIALTGEHRPQRGARHRGERRVAGMRGASRAAEAGAGVPASEHKCG